ncbi:kelch-like protein 29 [Elysia marginata]|uniref:Kelch-like protein 29 n=1 Tax=Elysia marginata TaxID=1093978 RepID=A0AAV4FNR5_9GAST|nr:kelch-like protein 29 [Elysia marginata]
MPCVALAIPDKSGRCQGLGANVGAITSSLDLTWDTNTNMEVHISSPPARQASNSVSPVARTPTPRRLSSLSDTSSAQKSKTSSGAHTHDQGLGSQSYMSVLPEDIPIDDVAPDDETNGGAHAEVQPETASDAGSSEEGAPDFRYRHLADVMSALGGLWRRRLYTDLTLVVEGKAIRCHKIILASASPYFHTRLFTGRRESPIDKIFVTNVSRCIMEDVIDFIYTGECAIGCDNAEEILSSAALFQIPSLHDMADLYLSENVDTGNCLRLFKISSKTGSSLTLEQSKWVVLNHFVSLYSTPMFKQLSCKELITILSSSELVAPAEEDMVTNAVISWLEADRAKRRSMLSEILRHVKIPKDRKEYIKQVLEIDPIAKKDVVCQRLMRRVKRSAETSLLECINKNLEAQAHAMKDDSVVFIGGIITEDNKFKCKQQVLAFNMEFRKFYPLASLPMGCDSGVASCVYGDDIFVSGVGEGRHGLIRYVSQQNLWRVLAPMMLGRRGHVMVAHEGSLYVLGGMVDHLVDGNKRITASIERYDIKRNRWQQVGDMPEGVWGASAVVHGAKIVTFGGYQSSRDNPTSSVQTLDIHTGLARVSSQLPFPVALTQAARCGSAFYIVCPTGNVLRTVDCWRFQSAASIPDFRRAMFGLAPHRDRLLVAGGKFNQEAYDDVLLVDPVSHTVVTIPERLPRPTYGFVCCTVALPRGHMVKMAFE